MDIGYSVVLIAPAEQPEICKGVRIVPIPQTRNRLLRMTATCFKAFHAALRERADLYHIHDPELLFWAQLLRLLRKRVVFDMHENLPKATMSKPWVTARLRPAFSAIVRLAERILLTRMPVVFAERSYTGYYSWVVKSTVVMNMPIVRELMAIGNAQNRTPTIGYLGAVARVRGSTALLEALRLLKNEGIEIGLELIGPISDGHRAELRALMKSYHLGHVNIRGYMKPEDAWPLIARCKIGAAILMPEPNYVDSYPTKIFEYMGLGLPVLASDFPLYKEVVLGSNCGICVNPQDTQEIASALRCLVLNPELASQLGHAGRDALSKEYNWESESKKLITFYADILGTRQLPILPETDEHSSD